MVRVRVRLGYTMAICLVLATPSKHPTFAFLVNFQFRGENFRANGAWSLHVVTWRHLILLRITKIAEGWSHTVFTPSLEATTSTRMFGKLPSVNCYLASNIHDPYAVAVVETGVATRIVGHVPRVISSVCRLLSDL